MASSLANASRLSQETSETGSSMALLRVGDVFIQGGCEYVVDYVNESRARCQPLTRTPKTITVSDRNGEQVDKVVNRIAGSHDFSISPNSDVEIVRRLSGVERDNLLERTRARTLGLPVSGALNAGTSNDSMNKKTKSDLPTKGRAEAIHKLRDAKVPKAEVLEKIQAKFRCPKGLFDKIWERDSRGAAKPKAAKPAKKAKAGAKAKSTPPAKKKGGPPPKPAPVVASEPAQAAPATPEASPMLAPVPSE